MREAKTLEVTNATITMAVEITVIPAINRMVATPIAEMVAANIEPHIVIKEKAQ